jgi:NADPH:quinone reductase-like Zn-dependent oxidoreductase
MTLDDVPPSDVADCEVLIRVLAASVNAADLLIARGLFPRIRQTDLPVTLGAFAAIPLAALTAWQGLFKHGNVQSGQRVLILGAAGGVGHFAGALTGCRFICQRDRKDFEQLSLLVRSGRLHPRIAHRVAFEQAPEALKLLDQGGTRGKIIITS